MIAEIHLRPLRRDYSALKLDPFPAHARLTPEQRHGYLLIGQRRTNIIGEIEQCIAELRELHKHCTVMGNSYTLSQIHKVLASLDNGGYGDTRTVKDFREEMREKAKKPCSTTSDGRQ